MKTELKAKFLQNILRNKKEDEGFTLIELLVVIIIIGILSAIALPSFLNQANKAKQSEAKTIAGTMNRAQQTYLLEAGQFASAKEFGNLGLGVKTQSQNYKYVIAGGGAGKNLVTNQAQLLNTGGPLKAYVGGVVIGTVTETSETTSLAILCEAVKAGSAGGPNGTQEAKSVANQPACPDATAWKDLAS
ncbi:MAG: type IV pilin-like G/H family protein [Nostocales cyanobacterium 94392]|nr:type IV pilin-like G/H family protein [Nostocales cyanobacterium 94392]